MLLFRYLGRRFLLYLLTLDFLLAFIFNFIEFFEKMVRVKHTTAGVIIAFLRLNFIPTFLDLLLISTWLATCFVIKELFVRHEWELLHLLTFIPQRFFMLMLTMGIFISTAAFVLYENCGAQLAFRAESFKKEKFKQSTDHILMTTWLELDNNRLCYFSVLDTKTLQGQDLLLIAMSPKFTLQSVVKASSFTIDFATMAIIIPEGLVFDSDQQCETMIYNKKLVVPAFFSQLGINLEVPRVSNMIKKAIFYRDALPPHVYDDVLGKLFTRLAYFMQLLLCPLFVFALFMCCSHPYGRWVAALSAYPLFIVVGIIGDKLFQYGLHPLIIFAPLLVILFFIIWCWIRRYRYIV
jgi:hypothetical protein